MALSFRKYKEIAERRAEAAPAFTPSRARRRLRFQPRNTEEHGNA